MLSPLLCFLLQVPIPNARTVGEVALWLFVSIPILEKLYGWISGRGRDRAAAVQAQLERLAARVTEFVDEETLEKRFAGIEEKHRTVGLEVANQHNTIMELLRERERLVGEFGAHVKQLQKDVSSLEPFPARVSNLEAKFDTLNERIANIKEGMGELREGQRDNKKEILDAIAKIKP